jgi:DNA-binding transcriptional MerR regulator
MLLSGSAGGVGGVWRAVAMADSGGNLVPIGRFSAICRLTIKALRHYDDLGLLKPAQIDPNSGYRYYSLRQVETATLIRTLRATEMPLEEIKLLLAEDDPEAVRAHLLRHQERIRARIAAQQETLALLDQLITRQEVPMTYTIEVADVPAQRLASTRLTIPPSDVSIAIPRGIAETMAYLQRHGGQPIGPPVVLYQEGMPDDDAMTIEVGWPVAAALPAEGAFGPGSIGGTTVARTTHIGPYTGLQGAFAALVEWVQAHGHELHGPPWESYVTNPAEEPDPAKYRTDIAWPIR